METGCHNAPLTIVAGDALTTLVEQPDVDLGQYGFLHLYYAAFGSRRVPATSNIADRFIADYQEDNEGEGGDIATSLSEPALNYDALTVMAEAINNVNAAGSNPTPGLVAAELRHGQIDLDGVTGTLTFGAGTDRRVPRDKPVLIFDARAADAPILACGQFTSDEAATTWGDGHPCPSDEE